jgi:hypothetical protein
MEFYSGVFYQTFGLITPPLIGLPPIGTYGLLMNGNLFQLVAGPVWNSIPLPPYGTFLDNETQNSYVIGNTAGTPFIFQREVCGYLLNTVTTATLNVPTGTYTFNITVDPDLSPFVALITASNTYQCFFYQGSGWYNMPVDRFAFSDLSGSGTALIDNSAVGGPTVQDINCNLLDLSILGRYIDCKINPIGNPNNIIDSNSKIYLVNYLQTDPTQNLNPQPGSATFNNRFNVYATNNINNPTTAITYNNITSNWTFNPASISAYPAMISLSGCDDKGDVNVVYIIEQFGSIDPGGPGIGINTYLGGEQMIFRTTAGLPYYQPPVAPNGPTLFFSNIATAQVGDNLYFPVVYSLVSGTITELFYGTIQSITGPSSGVFTVRLQPGTFPTVSFTFNTTIRTANYFAILKKSPQPLGRHTEGINSVALGSGSHAENSSIAIGDFSHSQGVNNLSVGYASHTEGYGNYATGRGSHTEGINNYNLGLYSHLEGDSNTTNSTFNTSHMIGSTNSIITGTYNNCFVQGRNISMNRTGTHTFNECEFHGTGHTIRLNTQNDTNNRCYLLGTDCTIGNGTNATTLLENSFAFGRGMNINFPGCVILGDNFVTTNNTNSDRENMFICRFNAGADNFQNIIAYKFYTSSTNNTLFASLGSNQTAWDTFSRKSMKDKVADIDFSDYLSKFEQLTIEQWKYRGGSGKLYNTPYLDELENLFGSVYDGDRMDTIQLDSISIATIKALCIEKNAMKTRIATLEQDKIDMQNQIDKLDIKLQTLSELVQSIKQ